MPRDLPKAESRHGYPVSQAAVILKKTASHVRRKCRDFGLGKNLPAKYGQEKYLKKREMLALCKYFDEKGRTRRTREEIQAAKED